jgi:hypothetical protein
MTLVAPAVVLETTYKLVTDTCGPLSVMFRAGSAPDLQNRILATSTVSDPLWTSCRS